MNFENQSIMPTAEPFLFQGGDIGCLLVHGFTGTPKEMRLLGEHLANKGHTVLGIRLAGHATRPQDLVRTRWQDWLCSVEDGLHMLHQSCSKVFVAGLSMGGMLSTLAASRFPITGIILMSTLYRLPSDWRLNFIGLIKYLMPEIEKGEDDWHDPTNSIEHRSYPKYPVTSVAELAKLMQEMRNSLKSVQVPTIIIQSKNDAVVTLEHADLFYENLGSSDKEIFLVTKCGHIITRDTEKEVVFNKVDEFILRISNA